MVKLFAYKTLIGVLVIIRNDNKVLLVEQIHAEGKVWRLPGGFVEKDEDPELAIIRELKEELSLELKHVKLKSVCFDKNFLGIIITFETFIENSPKLKVSSEIIRASFFNKTKIPSNIIASHKHLIGQ